MLRKVKKQGFTLIELMIVIAVIALLILVLVPRIGLIKNKSREAGLRNNMLTLEGTIQSVIDDYTTAQIAALETRIHDDINAADGTIHQKIRNPVTGLLGCAQKAAINTAAVSYLVTDDDGPNAAGDTAANWPATLAGSEGVIVYMAYYNNVTNKINVKLIPYGQDGKRITALEKTIGQ